MTRLLDALPLRLAARGVARWRTRRAVLPPFPAWPTAGSDPVRAVATLHARGAYEEAMARAEVLLQQARPETQTVVTLARLLIAVGDPRAEPLCREHLSSLAATPAGATLIDAMDLRPHPPLRLPDGSPHLLAMSRAVGSGAMGSREIERELRPHEFVRHPQAHLVLAQASAETKPERAGRALSRFFDVYGVAPVTLAGGDGSFLARLGVERRPPVWGRRKVTVMMAAYRASDTIGYAVASLLAQTYRPLEILICDDASPDTTVEQLRARYARCALPEGVELRLFRSRRNQGPYGIRNALLAEATGALITVHDADDLALPERIAEQVTALDGGHAASIGRFLRVTERGRFVFFGDQNAHRLSVASLLVRRSVLEQLGPYRTVAFGADHELLQTLRERFSIAYLKHPVHLGLWSDQSLTRSEGFESLESGYRSPARRRYAELVEQRLRSRVDERAMRDELEALGILREPSPIDAL